MKIMLYLLIFVPLSIVLRVWSISQELLFITVCLSIIPLAALIGDATEQISIYTGSKAGGLISATMSNVPELLIGFFAVRKGLYGLVLSSMAGSIISNILLVLGLSILLGGLKHKYQSFSKSIARCNFLLLIFAALSIMIPFTLQYVIEDVGEAGSIVGLTAVSLCMAVVFLLTYISGLIFSFKTHSTIFIKHEPHQEEKEAAKWSLKKAVLVLIAAALCVAFESEMLISTVEHIISRYGFKETFIGIIIIPLLGNVAENTSAIIMAVRNKVDLSIEIAIGSCIQIALFVAPLLIFVSFFIGNPIVYVFNAFQLVAMLIAIGLSLYVFQDGRTNWLEGLVLVSSYAILGVAFFFI